MKTANRCYNCLCNSHLVNKCKSRRSCTKCHKRHHTLLHEEQTSDSAINVLHNNINSDRELTTTIPSDLSVINNSDQINTFSASYLTPFTVDTIQHKSLSISRGLLQTAIVNIRGSDNQMYSCRALLDSGSLVSFVTEAFTQKMGSTKQNQRVIIEGLSSSKVGISRGKTSFEAFSRYTPTYSFIIDALVLPKITTKQPQLPIMKKHWHEFAKLFLADPTFGEPGDIDLLIGCDHYLELLMSGQKRSSESNLIAQETYLGWIVSGTTNININKTNITFFHVDLNVDETLKRFWELEEIDVCKAKNPNDAYCENHFTSSFSRSETGMI